MPFPDSNLTIIGADTPIQPRISMGQARPPFTRCAVFTLSMIREPCTRGIRPNWYHRIRSCNVPPRLNTHYASPHRPVRGFWILNSMMEFSRLATVKLQGGSLSRQLHGNEVLSPHSTRKESHPMTIPNPPEHQTLPQSPVKHVRYASPPKAQLSKWD